MKTRGLVVSSLTLLAVLFLMSAVLGAPPPAQAQSIQVLSANPNTAEQGTVNLNVVIKGKGFKTGARAEFLVTRTNDPGGVRVNSTAFVDATTLTVNIDVADTAVLAKFDIQVTNRDGRGGRGTELFSVTAKGTGPTPTIDLYAEFRDARDVSGKIIDKIHGDGQGFYSSAVLARDSGTLIFKVAGPLDGSARRIMFEFTNPSRQAPIDSQGRATCREYAGTHATFSFPAPSFIRDGVGVPNNDYTNIVTHGQFTYDTAAGKWSYAGPSFNLAAMPLGTTPAYVSLDIYFNIIEQDQALNVMFNNKLWGGLNGTAGLSTFTGIAKVTHPDTYTWVLEPLPPSDPAAPIISLGPNEASLSMLAPEVRKVHTAGYCDLGDWMMPFQLTLRRR